MIESILVASINRDCINSLLEESVHGDSNGVFVNRIIDINSIDNLLTKSINTDYNRVSINSNIGKNILKKYLNKIF